MELKNNVALITGATRGIGKTIATQFAAQGAKLCLNYRKPEAAEALKAELKKSYNTEVLLVKGDVSIADDVNNIVKTCVEHFGTIDVLVNNAGVTRDNLLLRMKEEDWDFVLETNLKSVFLLTKTAIRPMLKAKKGRIINISSIVGEIGNAGQANYSASKGGLIALSKTLAKEFAAKNITVNAVTPGYIQTDMTAELGDEAKEKLVSNIPLARLGQPEDIANACVFLASEKASYITGQVLGVNGGMAM